MKDFNLNEDSIFLDEQTILGVATSSYQIEGAVKVDGRLESIWDRFTKTEGKVLNGDTGDIACEHYYRFKEDVALIAALGFSAYRFSLAWPRILDIHGQINTKGIDFYKRLLDELHKYSIKPFATLYHWDLPQYLEERGGWLNRETAYLYADYSQKVMEKLGDRFASVATLNEPFVSSHLGYNFGIHAPGIKDEKAGFTAAHHLLLGHGLAMQAIRAENSKIDAGIVLNFTRIMGETKSHDDQISALVEEEYNNDWFIRPVLIGEYPKWLQKLKSDKMPMIKEGDMQTICQPLDFLGVNYYTRNITKAAGDELRENVRIDDVERTYFDWEVYPEGLYDILTHFNEVYDLPPIYITENGCAYDDKIKDGFIDDEARRSYYEKHLNAVDKAAKAGVPIKGYFAWSLMDNFEWAEGYDKRFGIVHMDFETLERTPKHSALAFQELNQKRYK
ncbi:MAG: GH1 family beta-glucosidase [Alphaproteobacteria bacterium]